MTETGQILTQFYGKGYGSPREGLKRIKRGFCKLFLKSVDIGGFRGMAFKCCKRGLKGCLRGLKGGLNKFAKFAGKSVLSQPRFLGFFKKLKKKEAHGTHGIHGTPRRGDPFIFLCVPWEIMFRR